MITVETACNTVVKHLGYPYIGGISENNDYYFVDVVSEDGQGLDLGVITCVDKETGIIHEISFYEMCIENIRATSSCKVPTRFRCPNLEYTL